MLLVARAANELIINYKTSYVHIRSNRSDHEAGVGAACIAMHARAAFQIHALARGLHICH